jgi:hypothetical protein
VIQIGVISTILGPVTPRCRIPRVPFAPAVIAAIAIWVGCDEPQTGSPGLEPPNEVGEAGASGSAAGRAGSTGAAGRAGSSGGAGTGSGTVTPTPNAGAGGAGGASEPDTTTDSPSCEPIGETLDVYARNERGEQCGHPAAPESGVANFDGAWISDLPLTTPLEPGQPYAITLSPPKSGSLGGIEIWGSEDACGPVDELLWYGDMEGRAQCVELMPTRAHSRLQFVTRPLEPEGDFTAGPGTVVLCPGGSCPAGSDGHPLEPGVTLEPPPGAYALTCSGSGVEGEWCDIGVLGQLLLIDDPAGSGDSAMESFASGVFRLPPNDPYGDAWYCLGGGSYLREDEVESRFDVHLAQISELPPCESGTSTASFEWMISQPSAVTSDVAELAALPLDRRRCFANLCRFGFYDSATRASTHLFVTLDGDVDASDGPIDLQVLEAAWFTVPEEGSPVRRACSTSGTLHYDYDAVSSLELDALGDFVSCPGDPAEDATLDLVGGRPIDI